MIRIKVSCNRAGDRVTGKLRARNRGVEELEKEMISAVIALWESADKHLGEGRFMKIVAQAKMSLENRDKETEA